MTFQNRVWLVALQLALVLSTGRFAASAAETGVDSKTFEKLVKPVLEKYCVDCHGPEKQKASLRYDGIDGFRISDRHLWTMIHEQVADDAMPPEKKPQLTSSEKKKVLAWIE